MVRLILFFLVYYTMNFLLHIGMNIEKYCQCFLSSITCRGLSFPKDEISSSPHPRILPFHRDLISRMGKFQFFFFNFSVFDKENTFGKKTKVFNSNVFWHIYNKMRGLKRVYRIRKLLITYKESSWPPLRFQ